MNLINNINQIPNTGRLFIVWQEPKGGEGKESGRRFVVGEILYNDEFEQINYFDNDDLRDAQSCGLRKLDAFAGKEGNKLTNKEISNSLGKRVIARDRDDFDRYLKSYMISPSIKNDLDTLTLLANTGRGHNFGDGYSFFPDIQNAKTPFQITFGIAGHRHSEGMTKESNKMSLQGKKVELRIDKNNQYDPYAIEVLLNDTEMGYVPKGLNKRLSNFIESNKIEATIARINGTTERPNLIILTKILE